MGRARIVTFLLATAAVAAVCVPFVFEAPPVTAGDDAGRITYIDGQMKKATGESDWVGATTNDPVNTGARVKTLADSRGELDLARLEIVRLAPETQVDIVKLFEETADQRRATELHVAEGDVWANIGSLDANTSLDITTDVSVTAVRGTVFRMSTSKAGTDVRVYNGRVEVANRPPLQPEEIRGPGEVGPPRRVEGPGEVRGPGEVTMEEWTYIVREYQRIMVTPRYDVGFFGSFSPSDPSETTDWVNWNKERDQVIGH